MTICRNPCTSTCFSVRVMAWLTALRVANSRWLYWQARFWALWEGVSDLALPIAVGSQPVEVFPVGRRRRLDPA